MENTLETESSEPAPNIVFVKDEPNEWENLEHLDVATIGQEELVLKDEPEDGDALDKNQYKSQTGKIQSVFTCDECDYRSKQKSRLESHQLQHKDPSEVEAFPCDQCNYSTIIKLQSQANSAQPTLNLSCDQCDYRTHCRSSFRGHALVHAEPQFACDQCDYTTRTKETLRYHMDGHRDRSEVETFRCTDCPFETRHITSIKTHVLQHRDVSQDQHHKCPHCPKEFRLKSSLKKHIVVHKEMTDLDKIYSCDLCSFRSKYSTSLVFHSLQHRDPDKEKLFGCNLCSFRTNRKDYLKTHRWIHRDPEHKLVCPECMYATQSKYSMRTHMMGHNKFSAEKRIFSCTECGYKAMLKTDLEAHKAHHSVPNDLGPFNYSKEADTSSDKQTPRVEVFKCDKCPYESKIGRYYRKHEQLHEKKTLAEMHTCDECGFQTKHKHSLNAHQLHHKYPKEVRQCRLEVGDYKGNCEENKKIEKYCCDQCSFKTIHASRLKYHVRIHQTDREPPSFRCNECSYSAPQKSQLQTHLLVHRDSSTVRMFACKQCDFRTKYKGNVKKHELTHADPAEIKFFNCGECDYKSKSKYDLKVHKLRHHREKTQPSAEDCAGDVEV